MIHMLLVGYCYGIRSERRLCEKFILALRTAGFVVWVRRMRCRTIRSLQRMVKWKWMLPLWMAVIFSHAGGADTQMCEV